MAKLPQWPKKKGTTTTIESIDGRPMRMTIEDEICVRQKSAPIGKLIYIQKMRFDEDGRIEYRFAYYRIGFRKGARDRWVFAQYAPLIPPKDLRRLIKKAQKRKWPGF